MSETWADITPGARKYIDVWMVRWGRDLVPAPLPCGATSSLFFDQFLSDLARLLPCKALLSSGVRGVSLSGSCGKLKQQRFLFHIV